MSDHERCEEALLEDEPLGELEAHLESCEECQSLAAALHRLDELVASVLAPPQPPPGLLDAILAQVLPEKEERQ